MWASSPGVQKACRLPVDICASEDQPGEQDLAPVFCSRRACCAHGQHIYAEWLVCLCPVGATWTLRVCAYMTTWPQNLTHGRAGLDVCTGVCALLPPQQSSPVNAHSGLDTWPAYSSPSRISSQGGARAARHQRTPPPMVTRPTKACVCACVCV